MLNRIIGEVEDHLIQKTFRKFPRDFGMTEAHEAVIFNAMQLADDIEACAIVMLTRKGELTKIMSKLHPKQPIFSLAANPAAQRQLNLYWGVFPIAMAEKSPDARIRAGIKILRARASLRPGDKVIFIYRDYQTKDLNLKVVGI
jgi:pyruvate kinase